MLNISSLRWPHLRQFYVEKITFTSNAFINCNFMISDYTRFTLSFRFTINISSLRWPHLRQFYVEKIACTSNVFSSTWLSGLIKECQNLLEFWFVARSVGPDKFFPPSTDDPSEGPSVDGGAECRGRNAKTNWSSYAQYVAQSLFKSSSISTTRCPRTWLLSSFTRRRSRISNST